MLYMNHQNIRDAFEMARAPGPEQSNYQRIIQQFLAQMREEITKGQTVIITKRDPKNPQSISEQETALVIRNEEDLAFYKNMLAELPDALSGAMLQAKLQKAMSEVNMNA